MKIKRKTFRKALIILGVVIAFISATAYFGLQYLKHKLESQISSCDIESKNFTSVLDFDYVNNWIVVYASIGDGDKKYPFFFDTGASTVIMDSLLNDIGTENYIRTSYGERKRKNENAFNNELIELNSLSLGDVKFSKIGALTAKNSKWGMLNCISPYGILGYNIIQNSCFQIDYDKQQITITDNVESLTNYSEIRWIDYKPLNNQESPIIEATINDSIIIKLMFDTGNRGGIVLSSEKLFNLFKNDIPDRTVIYLSRPSLLIRGEEDKVSESLLLSASKIKIGNFENENIKLSIDNDSEGRYTGLIGNKYFENFIITLDYKHRRIGFIPKHNYQTTNSTFGISLIPSAGKLKVSKVLKEFGPYNLGIKAGDLIYSVNGVKIDNLQNDKFCEIYRNEFRLYKETDSILNLEILQNNSIQSYSLKKEILFKNL